MASNHHTDEVFREKRIVKNPIKFKIPLNEDSTFLKTSKQVRVLLLKCLHLKYFNSGFPSLSLKGTQSHWRIDFHVYPLIEIALTFMNRSLWRSLAPVSVENQQKQCDQMDRSFFNFWPFTKNLIWPKT